MKQHKQALGVKPEHFYQLIGKMTLMHAGIEHDLKGVLSEDWGVPYEEVEWLYGFKLRTFFLEKIELLGISEEYYAEYSLLVDRYWRASERRNELVKASYGLIKESGEVFRYDFKACGGYSEKVDKEKRNKLISLEELESLIDELFQIREANFQLSKKIYLEGLEYCISHNFSS